MQNTEQIEVGLILPELTVTPDRTQLFMYSAVTWNRHRIHYSKDDAIHEKHQDIVVQRGLIGNFMVRHVTQWIGDSGEITNINWRMKKSAYPDQPLTCSGQVIRIVHKNSSIAITCSLQINNSDGDLISDGEATICCDSLN